MCDEHDDDLWVHPHDLPLPHEDCPLCHSLVVNREWSIEQAQRSIELLCAEISEIRRGMRHNAYHEQQRQSSVTD